GGFAPAVGPTPAAIIETVQASSARTSPTSGRQPRSCGLLVDGHDGGAAEADVVLQGDLGALDLAGVGRAAQLPDELRALRQAGGAERVALGDQAPRGIDDGTVAAVGGGLGVDELVALALAGKTERLVGDQLVGAEAVVELHHVHFLDPGLGLIQRTLGCRPCHVGADDHDRGLRLEGARQVGHHCLAGDLAGLGTQAMSFDEALACDDRGGAAVGWGRALQLCQWRVYLLGVLDVLQRVLVLELRKGVVDGVLVVLPPDPGVVLGSRAVSLHVLASSHPEHLRGKRRGLPLPQLPERSHVTVHRIGAICELGAQRPHLHLLEAEGERAVDEPALDGLASEIQGARASRAVVVDVDHRDAGEPKPIQGSLTGSGVAVAIRREGLLDRLVGNPGIGERQPARLLGPVGVIAVLGTGLLESRHADADDICAVAHERAFRASGQDALTRPRWRPASAAGCGSCSPSRYYTNRALARFSWEPASIELRGPATAMPRTDSPRPTPTAPLTPRRTQQERRDETRAKLLDATIESLVEVGYSATTTRLLAERAGVSSGAHSRVRRTSHHPPHRRDEALRSAARPSLGRLLEQPVHSLRKGLGRRRRRSPTARRPRSCRARARPQHRRGCARGRGRSRRRAQLGASPAGGAQRHTRARADGEL